MRFRLFAFGLLLLLPGIGTAHGKGAPLDTLTGEARLVGHFTKGLCEQIALQSRHQDLTVLTKAQGLELLNEVLLAVILQDSTEFKAVLARAPNPTVAMQRLSMQAILRLANACPSSSRLLVQMGVQMSAIDTTLTPLQQRALQAVAHSFCEKLTTTDVQKPFSQCSTTERIAAYNAARHELILAHGAALVQAFGQQLLSNGQLENNMWQNVDRLMFDECRALTAQLRTDRGFAQLQADSAGPTAAPKPAVVRPAGAPGRRSTHKR
jgi:hypothetical protein